MNWKRWNSAFTWSLGGFCPFSAVWPSGHYPQRFSSDFPNSQPGFLLMVFHNAAPEGLKQHFQHYSRVKGMGRKGNVCLAQLWSWRKGNLCLFGFFSHAVRKTCKWSVKEKLFCKQTGAASLEEQGHQENPRSRAQLREITESWDWHHLIDGQRWYFKGNNQWKIDLSFFFFFNSMEIIWNRMGEESYYKIPKNLLHHHFSTAKSSSCVCPT